MLIYISLLCLLCGALSANPGYELLVTKKGLDFLSHAGGKVVENVLKNTKIPPFKGGESSANLEVKNINFKQFSGENLFYGLEPPSTVKYGLTDAALEIDADFVGKTHVMLLPDISISGKIQVKATGVAVSLSNSITIDESGRPIVKATDCSAHLGTFTLSLSGSVAAWIAQIFHTLIESEIKPKIIDAICDNAKKTINRNLGEQVLKAVPNPVPIHGGFAFSYKLDMINVSKMGIAFAGEGNMLFNGQGAKSQEAPKLITKSNEAAKMGYFYASDYVLNSAGKIAHEKGLTKIEINEGLIPQVRSFLRTSCAHGVCVGSVLSELSQKYPNRTCSIKVVTNSPPIASFSESGIHLELDIGVSLRIYDGKKNGDTFFSGARLWGSADFAPKIHERHVNASFQLNSFDVKEQFSTLEKPINWKFIEESGKHLLGVQLQQFLEKGIMLPQIKDVHFLRPEIKTTLHTLEVATDLGTG